MDNLPQTTVTTSTTSTGAINDELFFLFGGRSYPVEVLKNHAVDIDWMMKTEKFCDVCSILESCVMPSPGWQLYFDESGADVCKRPSFRLKRCNQWKNENAKQQQEIFIAPRFAKRSFETFKVNDDNKEAYDFCYAYALQLSKNTDTGVMLIGPEGTGKTHLASAVLRIAFQHGLPGAFLVTPNLLEEIRQSYRDKEGGANVVNIELAINKRLIVLDDLGAEKTTDWVREQLYRIINARYEKMLPTIITSNCSTKELAERLGAPTMGRLLEMCEVKAIIGKSWRRRR